MHVTAIIAAAGEGRRLGAAVPKQLLQIGDRSILERSVAAFAGHDRVNDVIVVLPPATTRTSSAISQLGGRTRWRMRSIGWFPNRR